MSTHAPEPGSGRKKHIPFVPETMEMKEFTLRAILIGAVMTGILGAANAYLGLKAGMTIAATYPAAVIGLALLLVGVILNVAISVAGFVVMLVSCYWGAMSYRRMNGLATGRLPLRDRRSMRREKRGARNSGTGFGDRLEARWRRRQAVRDS